MSDVFSLAEPKAAQFKLGGIPLPSSDMGTRKADGFAWRHAMDGACIIFDKTRNRSKG